jgi:hypothetical protein
MAYLSTNDALSAELLRDERLEWTGRPNPRVIFHQSDLFQIPFSILWGGFAIFWELGASGLWEGTRPRSGPGVFMMLWGLPFVLIGQYMIWGRFVWTRWLKERTVYGLTDRRAVIVIDGPFRRTVVSAWFSSLSVIDKQIGANGNGSISFGAEHAPELRPIKKDSPRPPAFDDVDQANSVYETAIRLYDVARRRST